MTCYFFGLGPRTNPQTSMRCCRPHRRAIDRIALPGQRRSVGIGRHQLETDVHHVPRCFRQFVFCCCFACQANRHHAFGPPFFSPSSPAVLFPWRKIPECGQLAFVRSYADLSEKRSSTLLAITLGLFPGAYSSALSRNQGVK